ncbi:hypothetical protein KV580_12905 [Pseudomonas chlororaphis]|nr:hypothetical protein [Pseudomonas chlororaphis]
MWIASLCAWAIGACADQAGTVEQRFSSFIIADFARATTAMDVQQQACRDTERVLPANLLKLIGLSDEEKKITLLYFRSLASWECEKQTVLELLAATQMVRDAGLPDFSATDDPQNLAASVQLMGHATMLRYKARYQALPESKRGRLERIEALRQPFKLLESTHALGLSASPEQDVIKREPPDKERL